DADTTAMLANYQTGINSKVNILDTASMLQPYLRDVDTTSMLLPYLRGADTTNMLANYRTGINTKVNISDTLNMLQPYLRSADTTSMLLPYLRDADTTAMLANYFTGINAKVNILDTASMLQPYLRDADTTSMLSPYLRDADTTAMLNNYRTGISTKVNILDTASMLQPYLRDTDTTSMLSPYLRRADTTVMLTPYLRDADTTSMLSSYLRRADTTLMLTPYLRDADTTSMLSSYLRRADTTSMLMPYLRDADTTNMLLPYLLDSDTSNMLSNYRAGLNAKAPINNPTFTGTVSGITQAMVGLPNVDNTSDVNKSISTATQTALNLKLNISDTAAMLLNYRNNGGGLPTSGNSLGDMLYWNGSAWVKLSAGSAGKVLKINGGIPEWTNADFNCGLATTDVDINTYNTVQIGQQCWMKENLKTSRYRNGDLIPVVVYSAWGVLTTGGRDWYSGDSTAYEYPYGNLYNWYAVGDSRGLCPTGWHVPTDAEWTILTTNLGGESVAGGRLKSTSSFYWGSTNTEADNLTGFSALPGGERSTGGSNVNKGSNAAFWSATDYGSNAWFRYLRFGDGMMTRGGYGKTYGASVRCLKD
ncbi:MAG: fibrobacter succinogenes major paralogous domain-containing protein, partial [Bacteroidota bacterium]